MRTLIALAFVLAALLSLTNTWALQNTSVSSGMRVDVVGTDRALLSLSPGVTPAGNGNAAGTAYLDAGTLKFNFGSTAASGFRQTPTGLTAAQKNVYEFRGLFTVTNTSSTSKCVYVYVLPQPGPGDLTSITLNGSQVAGGGGAGGPTGTYPCVTITSGQAAAVDMRWTIGTASVSNKSFSIIVEGK